MIILIAAAAAHPYLVRTYHIIARGRGRADKEIPGSLFPKKSRARIIKEKKNSSTHGEKKKKKKTP